MTTELICTHAELLAAELAAIEHDAAQKTKVLLEHQDTFRRAHDLAWLLMENGAPDGTTPTVVHHSSAPSFIFYAHYHNDEAEHVLNAIQDTRLPYRITDGFGPDVRFINIDGFDGIDIALPADLFLPKLATAAHA
ncbi:MAG: hypothetical protein ABIG70_03145 [Pseudomonadota bacterium]